MRESRGCKNPEPRVLRRTVVEARRKAPRPLQAQATRPRLGGCDFCSALPTSNSEGYIKRACATLI